MQGSFTFAGVNNELDPRDEGGNIGPEEQQVKNPKQVFLLVKLVRPHPPEKKGY